MTRLSVLTSAVAMAGLLACGDDDESGTPPGGEPSAGEAQDIAVDLVFNATVAGEAVACDTMYSELGDSGASGMLADARFFVSVLEARNADGQWVAIDLDQDTVWQHENVALIDFETGVGSCSATGTTETNDRVTGTLPSGEYSALRFQLGIPFELNHLDDASAPAPLNSPGMFWYWQDGYKFVRIDWMPSEGQRWNVHLGSRMCENGTGLQTDAPSSCSRSNRATITLENFDAATDAVDVDFAELVAGEEITTNLPDSPPGCMSDPPETGDCDSVFSSLGLDFATGACTDGCDGQTVFR